MLDNQSAEDLVQQYWVEFAAINKQCNDRLFPSKDMTTRLIQTGEYHGRVQELLPTLHKWHDRLESSSGARYSLTWSDYMLTSCSIEISEDTTIH